MKNINKLFIYIFIFIFLQFTFITGLDAATYSGTNQNNAFNLSDSVLIKVDKLVNLIKNKKNNLGTKYTSYVGGIKNKLKGLENIYSNNDKFLNIIGYLNDELEDILDDESNNNTTSTGTGCEEGYSGFACQFEEGGEWASDGKSHYADDVNNDSGLGVGPNIGGNVEDIDNDSGLGVGPNIGGDLDDNNIATGEGCEEGYTGFACQYISGGGYAEDGKSHFADDEEDNLVPVITISKTSIKKGLNYRLSGSNLDSDAKLCVDGLACGDINVSGGTWSKIFTANYTVGTHYATIMNGNGKESNKVTLEVISNPTPVLSINKTSVEKGGSFRLTAVSIDSGATLCVSGTCKPLSVSGSNWAKTYTANYPVGTYSARIHNKNGNRSNSVSLRVY